MNFKYYTSSPPLKRRVFILILFDMRLVDKMIKQTEEAQNNKIFIQHIIKLMDMASKEGQKGINIYKADWNPYVKEYFKSEGFIIEETLGSFIRIKWDKSVVEQEEYV